MSKENSSTPENTALYKLLTNLGNLVPIYQQSATTQARLAILTAFCSEAELLARKLHAMHNRWLTYLPFKEALDVRFIDWSKKVELWMEDIKREPKLLSTGFLLDLMGEDVVKPSDELKKDVPVYCGKIDKKLAKPLPEWEETLFGDGDGVSISELKLELAKMRQKALQDLEKLNTELKELEEFFSSELTPRQFTTLALRLEARDCKEVEKEAKKEVRSSHNSWPLKHVKERARAMREGLKFELLSNSKFVELSDYVEVDDPQLYEDASFGQYLFKMRHNLNIEDVQWLVKMLEKIRLCNEYMDPNGRIRKQEKKSKGRELDSDENKILKQLESLAEKGEWRGTVTCDTIKTGIRRMLGVEYNLDGETLQMSNQLWKLLKTRRHCDAEKSLQVTWLNIVGWCVRQMLLPNGSPGLCKKFYPNCGGDDYKAIDKGRQSPSSSFKKIEPLLEKFMK